MNTSSRTHLLIVIAISMFLVNVGTARALPKHSAQLSAKETLAAAREAHPCETAVAEFLAALDKKLNLLPDYALRLKTNPTAVVKVKGWEKLDPQFAAVGTEMLRNTAYDHNPQDVFNVLFKIQKNATIKDKKLAADVVKRLMPQKLEGAVNQNNILNALKELTTFYQRQGLGELDAALLAERLNSWDEVAMRGFNSVIEDANARMAADRTLSHSRAIEDALKARGHTREEIATALPCGTNLGLKR